MLAPASSPFRVVTGKARVSAAADAAKLALQIESEGRAATADEIDTLTAFPGWGCVRAAFAPEFLAVRQALNAGRWASRPHGYTEWESEYGPLADFAISLPAELRDGITAAGSTSHFTGGEVIDAIWAAVRRLGFKGGNVLEPTVGTGRFIAAMPADLRDESRIVGVECEPITASIARLSNPDCNIRTGFFQSAEIRDASFDLVVGNVPFSDAAPAGQTIPGAPEMNTHNYIIAHALTKVRPGGILALITSSATMQGRASQRRWLADHAELIGAIRLPEGAFSDAGTDVVADVLFLRRPDGNAITCHTWRACLSVEVAESDAYIKDDLAFRNADVNEYFVANPCMVLGRHSTKGRMYGAFSEGAYTVLPGSEPLAALLADAVSALPSNLFAGESIDFDPSEVITDKVGALVEIEGGTIAQVVFKDGVRTLQAAPWKQHDLVPNKEYRLAFNKALRELSEYNDLLDANGKPTAKARARLSRRAREHVEDIQRFVSVARSLPRGWTEEKAVVLAKDFIALRNAVRAQIDLDSRANTGDDLSSCARADLREIYQRVTRRHKKRLRELPLERIAEGDPELGLVLALESVSLVQDSSGKDIEVYADAAILHSRTIHPSPALTKPETVQDAVLQALGTVGVISAADIAARLGVDNDDALFKAIAADGAAFLNPETRLFESRAKYLSGNTRAKLRAAIQAANADPIFSANVAALEKAVPPFIPFDDEAVSKEMGQTWIPARFYCRFAESIFQGASVAPEIRYNRTRDSWEWSNVDRFRQTQAARVTYSVDAKAACETIDGTRLFRAAINGDRMRITYEVKVSPEKTETRVDAEATALCNSHVEKLRSEWVRFITGDESAKAELTDEYNEKVNCITVPVFDGSHLVLPTLGKGPGLLVPRPAQRRVVARMLEEMAGLIAHDVGFGKSLSICMTAIEAKRLGLARKPLIVCDNAGYAQMESTLRAHFPRALVLSALPDSMSPQKRTTFLSRIATGDFDAVIMAQSHFDLIPNSEAMVNAFYSEQIDDLKEGLEEERASSADARSAQREATRLARTLSKMRDRILDRLRAISDRADDCLTFDKLGVDLLIVDEAHKYKRASFVTRMSRVKGIDNGASMRGDSMLMKTRFIQSLRGNGRGVIYSTATPVSNTMAEAWNMMRMCYPHSLAAASAERFDEFRRNFCLTITAVELHEASGKWREETRLSKFQNPIPFISLIRSGWDVENDPNKAGLVRPDLLEGKMIPVVVPLNKPVFSINSKLQNVWAEFEKLSGKQKKVFSHIPLLLIGASMTAAIDPRLIDPSAEDHPGSVVNRTVKNVFEIWQKTAAGRETQVLFLDRRNSMKCPALEKLMQYGIKSAAVVEVEDAPESDDAADGILSLSGDDDGSREGFDLYRDIVSKLVDMGVPASEIFIAQDAKTPSARKAMFDKANRGDIRILLGSSQKLGISANFQTRLIAAHHVDAPRSLTPDALAQRNGRIHRQGNENRVVAVYWYGMADTATAGVIHRIQRKEFFVKQALAGNIGRDFEDCGSVDLEDLKACMVRDKRVLRRAELLAELRTEKGRRDIHAAEWSRIALGIHNATKALAQATEEADRRADKLAFIAREGITALHHEDTTEVSLSLRMLRASDSIGLKSADFSGRACDAQKFFAKHFERWKSRLELAFNQTEAGVAEGSLSGVPFRIMACYEDGRTFLRCHTFAPGTNLARIPTAFSSALATGHAYCPTANSIFTARTKAIEHESEALARHERDKARHAADLDSLKKLQASATTFDESGIHRVQADIAELESDLLKNPSERVVFADSNVINFPAIPQPAITRGVEAIAIPAEVAPEKTPAPAVAIPAAPVPAPVSIPSLNKALTPVPSTIVQGEFDLFAA